MSSYSKQHSCRSVCLHVNGSISPASGWSFRFFFPLTERCRFRVNPETLPASYKSMGFLRTHLKLGLGGRMKKHGPETRKDKKEKKKIAACIVTGYKGYEQQRKGRKDHVKERPRERSIKIATVEDLAEISARDKAPLSADAQSAPRRWNNYKHCSIYWGAYPRA